MTWTKPIVVGVDASPASAGAAAFALRIARAAGVPCHLVHAARETPLSSDAPERIVAMRAASLHALRADLERAMFNGGISRDIARGIDIRWGWPPAVLDDVVRERDAELLVLGAKHHSVLGRTLGGSTGPHALRPGARAPHGPPVSRGAKNAGRCAPGPAGTKRPAWSSACAGPPITATTLCTV